MLHRDAPHGCTFRSDGMQWPLSAALARLSRQDANKRKRKREKTPELGGGFVPLGDSLREHVPVLSTIRTLAPDIRTHPLQINRPYSAYTYRAYARKYARAAGNTAESISASAPVAAQQA